MSNVQSPQVISQEDIQVEAMRSLTKEIPLNDFGMPTGIYRTDLLPFHDYKPSHSTPTTVAELVPTSLPALEFNAENAKGLTEGLHEPYIEEPQTYRIAGFPAETIHNAFMPLQYDEGFPAFGSGLPFWAKLDYEPADAFLAFEEYLQMSKGKMPIDMEDEADEYNGEAATGSRNISLLATSMHNGKGLEMASLYQDYYHLYYWGMRAHSYDLCRLAQHRAQQEIRAVETLDDQYVSARRLRHRVMMYMENNEDFWDLMTPKIAIDVLKTSSQMERISAGLPAAGPPNANQPNNGGRTFEMEVQTISQTHRRVESQDLTEEGAILDRALESPESTEILQRLIIKAG